MSCPKNTFYILSASGVSNIVVVVTDDEPSEDTDKDDLEGDDVKDFGSHNGEVNEGDTIKIRPEDAVPGRFVVIYIPGEGVLSLGDVKIYVKPIKTPETPETPEGPETSKSYYSSDHKYNSFKYILLWNDVNFE